MNITILAIGKKHDPKLVDSIEEYTKRLTHYAKLEWKLTPSKVTSSMTTQQVQNIESENLLSHIHPTDAVVLLDERGANLSSPALSEKLQSYMNQATHNLIIVIGGAFGVNQDVFKRADFVWSLSPLVFPHQLVRLIVIEQLYRAHTIIAGEKYHHL